MTTLLFLVLPVVAGAFQDVDPQKMMEARFHLNAIFDKDMGAKVPVGDLGLPESATARFDTNGDGFVTFDEYEEVSRRSSPGPAEPSDRSAFTHLTEGGYPLNVDPEIVSVDEVDFGDEDIVMGIVINGEARAYPVNYMNGPYNEVVNDELGGQAIAPSW
ncbi:MAG: hypothetical protein BMS9Abin37_2969 [Acidobacteriota bacterium]|nr:MAG: hypothetical protein BMS9Abin37_2969 [Acidobacteriota bacterium]